MKHYLARANPRATASPLLNQPLHQNSESLVGRWVNPHREQQTIPQGHTSSPPKFVCPPTAKARPDQASIATSAEARGATRRARPRSPSLSLSSYMYVFLFPTFRFVRSTFRRIANESSSPVLRRSRSSSTATDGRSPHS